MKTIKGSCNQCGMCCGYNTNVPAFPFEMKIHYDQVMKGTYGKEKPKLLFNYVKSKKVGEEEGITKLDNKNIKWCWVKGKGLCKGTLLNHKTECPFLGEDTGDSKHPCLLYNTEMWNKLCQIYPNNKSNNKAVLDWQKRHPLCSYQWE